MAGGGFTVVVGDAIPDCNRIDRSGIGFGVKIPAVVDVIGGDTAVENIPRSGGKFTGKTVGVFAVVRIKVVVRVTI